jgi:glycosyltransferase involved in cell wall biosynthesis
MALTVSVAMCTHNGGLFIEEQLRSILDQSKPPAQIVVSDDASTDDTIERVKRTIAGSDISTLIIQNPVAFGVARNFEQAISAATGELIALCDQDDSWRSDRLKLLVSAFESRPELLLLHHDARLVDDLGLPIGATLFDTLGITETERLLERAGRAFEALMRRNTVTGATTVFRKTLSDIALPLPPGWIHDEWLAVIAAATGVVDFLEQELIDYRQHGSNQIGVTTLSLGGKFARIRESRGKRNAELLDRAASLVPRLEALGSAVQHQSLELSRQKLSHEMVRRELPAPIRMRIAPILREVRSGRYLMCGRGMPDIARDLIQRP